jgi:subtilisin family serine protease
MPNGKRQPGGCWSLSLRFRFAISRLRGSPEFDPPWTLTSPLFRLIIEAERKRQNGEEDEARTPSAYKSTWICFVEEYAMKLKLTMSIELGLLLGLASAARIEPDLLRRLEAADDPNQKFAVNFFMKDQARATDLDPNIPNLPKPERRARVGRVLMDFAEASRQDLLSYLITKEAEGQVEDISPLWIVNTVGCWATAEAIREVAQRSDVALVYYDRVPCEIGEIALDAVLPPTDGVPPNMIVTNVRGAWNQGYHGENVVLGVVDTGVWYTHEDLRNHLWTSPGYPHCGFNFASSQYSSGRPGPSSYDTLTPLDYFGHGTASAGVATADGTYGSGVNDTFGIAPRALVMSVPVDVYVYQPYPDTSSENNIMAGIQFCVRPSRDTLNGADVINLGLRLISSWLPRLALWRMAEENVLAAGISQPSTDGREGLHETGCPADCPPPWRNPANHPTGPGHERDTGRTAVITVLATDNSDSPVYPSPGQTWDWGNVAPWNDYEYPPGLMDPDLVMPGRDIPTTGSANDRDYVTQTGNSLATPAVSGAVCLMLSKNPDFTPSQIDSTLELYCVRDLGVPGKDSAFGAGRIDCSLAVAFTPLPTVALEEQPRPVTSPATSLPAIICGILFVPQHPTANTSHPVALLDITGCKVLDLHPGPNDVSRLTPGVYFVRSAINGQRSATTKVILTR